MFSFFKKKEVKTNGGSGLLPKEIVAEIKAGELLICAFGKDRAAASTFDGETVWFLSNKGSKNLLYKEVYRAKKYSGLHEAKNWILDGKLPARKGKKK